MPEYSSSWADIIKKNPSNENDIKFKIVQYEKQIPNQSWTIDEAEQLALDLIKNFPNIKRIDFAGGEPLYQKQFWAFLRKFINHPNVNNCSIVIISNFNTQIDYNELSNLLLHFKQSKIRISVDGGKGIYKYFRTGDWKTLTENIDFFKSINQKTMLEATCTISAYQILDIKNSIIDMFNLNVDRLHHTIVQYPTYLDPSILKSRFLTIIQKDINYIEEYLKKMEYNYKIKTTFEIVDRLRKIYTKSDTNEDDYNRFLYYIDRMDEIKKQNFDEHFPISKTELKC
jgi:organic radical activating enzyme